MKRVLLIAIAFAACIIKMQAQGTQAIISGNITEESAKTPVQGATVKVKNESTGFTTTTISNDKGDFIFKQLPLGTPYTVTVSYVGLSEQQKNGYSLNQGDNLRIDFAMQNNSGELKAVTVSGNSMKNSIKTMGSATSVTAREISKLPVNGRNFTSLIDLSPLSSGINLSGQLASSTNFTIDGMTAKGTVAAGTTAGAYSISMEAVREFKVVTNQYDVTYGRSGGGTISTVTKAGTNLFSGSAFTYARTNWLSSPYDLRGAKRDQDFSTYQYGFSLSGPIVKDKAHFFIAWDHQADSRPLYIADISGAADEARWKVTQSTLDQFQSIARAKYGLGEASQVGSFPKKKGTDAAFIRFDWQLNAKNLLTLRNNFIYDLDNESDGDNSGINLYEVYSSRKSYNNSLLLTLRTAIRPRLTNELKVQHFVVREQIKPNSLLPAASIPRAIVENVESVSGTTKYFNSIQLGGQRYTPEGFKDNVFQLVDNIYYNKGKVNFTFGLDMMYTHMKSRYGSEMNGRFYFTGMSNFDNQTPYRYARDVSLVPDPTVYMNILASGLYGQMETRIAPGLDMMAGVRLDHTQYFDRGNYSQVVDNKLGLRTDNNITTLQWQPRFQFTWDVNENRRDIVRFGAGIFGSDLNNYSMINNMLFDGTRIASIDVQGALVPTPDFARYRQDPTSAPAAELFEKQGISKLYTINTNSSNTKVPVVYKANISYNHFFTDKLRIGLSAYATRARNNYMYVDRNMIDQPAFRIAAEDSRGVYVPASTINPTNGATNWLNSRKTNDVGRVLELISEGKINQYSLVFDGTYRYFKDGQISFSYTWNDSKDNTSYNGNVANTATLDLMVKDDPRDLSKVTYANSQFRHKVVIYGTAPSVLGITFGARYSALAGTRYTLAVSGNMNGDFVSSNDLPFIYDINNQSTPQYLRAGIQAILDNPNAEESIKKYIRKNMGQIAERNGGENGFYGVLDLRLAKKFNFYRRHGLEASIDVFNFNNLLNKKWGVGHNLGKQNLYTIKSFSPEQQQFVYNVNGTTGVSTLNGNPYQVQIGLRYSF